MVDCKWETREKNSSFMATGGSQAGKDKNLNSHSGDGEEGINAENAENLKENYRASDRLEVGNEKAARIQGSS